MSLCLQGISADKIWTRSATLIDYFIIIIDHNIEYLSHLYAVYIHVAQIFMIFARQLSVGLGWGKFLTGHFGFSLVSLHMNKSSHITCSCNIKPSSKIDI